MGYCDGFRQPLMVIWGYASPQRLSSPTAQQLPRLIAKVKLGESMFIVLTVVIIIWLFLAGIEYENDQELRNQEGLAEVRQQQLLHLHGPHSCAKNCACYWDIPYFEGEGHRFPQKPLR
jgi:hypothetical protein